VCVCVCVCARGVPFGLLPAAFSKHQIPPATVGRSPLSCRSGNAHIQATCMARVTPLLHLQSRHQQFNKARSGFLKSALPLPGDGWRKASKTPPRPLIKYKRPPPVSPSTRVRSLRWCVQSKQTKFLQTKKCLFLAPATTPRLTPGNTTQQHKSII
jgi:hypothetical protein